jgi:aspartyl-tRNA(Asn)/glutamyl-tRNA(Gln) amidotransferase subunit C
MTKDDIVGFASLVKISITDNDAEALLGKMDSILGYIDQIKNVQVNDITNDTNKTNPELRDDIRIDSNFTMAFMENAPLKENNYIKVPRVLNND